MNETFASEIYKDLKNTIKFLKILVVVLVLALATMAIYHDYQWSQFDRVSIDSGEGPANYVGGENSGGIFNGTDNSTQEEVGQGEGDVNQVQTKKDKKSK